MKRSVGRATRLLASVAAVIATLTLGFAAAGASADPPDPVTELRPMHEEMHATRHSMGVGNHSDEMDEMHAQMSARFSEEDRALHDRMHEACGDHVGEEQHMKCLNWKVIAALGAVGIGLYVLAPGLAGAALPLLVLAVCPLSMLLMMRAIGLDGQLQAGGRHD
ncbi:MAG TPA: hypothetical protein VK988_13790 [Acidimicrobiales bacterium]|nr:hypothetical protein [Acidimicrobiales bacterium]